MIEETIQREIRPALQQDGGDLDLIDVVGNRVLVSTRGACASCAAAQITLKDFVEAKLKELVTPELHGGGGGPMTVIYLDNNATTQVDAEVLEAMLPFYHELYGNPSSMHSFGGQVGRQVREAREQVAALLGAAPDEIIFTSCGTESDNTAIRSALATFPDKRHIVTTRVEHPAINALVAQTGQGGLPGHRTAGGRPGTPGPVPVRRGPHRRIPPSSR